MSSCFFCNREVKGVCSSCGRMACSLHLNERLCYACSQALCNFCRSNLALTACSMCGRLVCRECSVEIDNVRRKCPECSLKKIDDEIQRARELSRIKRSYALILGLNVEKEGEISI